MMMERGKCSAVWPRLCDFRSMRNTPRHLLDVLSEGFWKTDGQTEVWDEAQWRGCRS